MPSQYVSAPASTPSALGDAIERLTGGKLELPQFTPTTVATSLVAVVVTLLIAEQALWRSRKRHLPGKNFQIPVIGQFAESLNPTMEAYKRSWATPLASVSVFNIFIVIASTTDYARKILNSSSATEPCLVRSAKQILLPENWVFLNGKVHNEYRKGLNVLFTPKALEIYLRVQDQIYRKFFNSWLADPTPGFQPYQMKFRDLNMMTSLRVFCGSYISETGAQEISDKYWLITQALELVNFPFAFPGTKVWNACKAREVAVKHLSKAAADSKAAMKAGKEADCLLDAWVEQIIAGKVREYSDKEMALVLLSFIFASQDAMSSSITFAFQLLADHPAVLAKIREEQSRVRAGDLDSPMSLSWLEQMPYTNAVTKEVLRYRPPVIMVPYLAKKDFPINDEYTVPKGTMIIPSFWNSLHDPEVYPDPEDFIPERWMPGGANADGGDSKNWLVFGAGAHKCIGQNYVYMHMSAVIGSAAMLMDWEHERTPESDEIQIIATLFPKDGCRLKFSRREQQDL
ncbi:Cytochrome P450 61 [Rhodotorula toruloides]|uniref:sterol 22-desaturase n=1 Tax=Rhodotorula toruloides TaxID=5286 RepID=A0A2S9ZWG3_RHOTO|nr:Cytochrome P450 61 [Rhodotorula toruloides]PRQ70063.1 cytochrome P450 [Rhodotorula toruloides]